jgi:beta-lactamase superfamily II metal-dependent hydrolase
MAILAHQRLITEFWDVGQGDATVIRIASGRVILIDVGPRNSPIIDWLLHNPGIYIDKLVLTHNDADHAGAVIAIIDGAKFRIGHVYFLLDRNRKAKVFAALFSTLVAAYERGEIKALTRLEAPQTIWEDQALRIKLDVVYPQVHESIPASSPNIASAVLQLSVNQEVKIVWAADSLIETVAGRCANVKPDFLVGPHHGAPADRASARAQQWLDSIGATTNVLSVGSNNPHDHPQKSYIRKSLAAGSTVLCTQLTPLCDRSRSKDVVKSHARLAIPQPNTGVACRGSIRIVLHGDTFVGDELDAEHQKEIKKLSRPQCLLLRPKPKIVSVAARSV